MGNRSTIERLDPDIVEQVTRLIKGGRTIDEITQHLRDLDQDVSRSAVGRYVQKANKAMETYAKGQAVAKGWVEKIEAEPNGDVARLLPMMLQAVAFKQVEEMTEAESAASPGDIMFMAKAIQSLAASSKTHVDLELKLRQVRDETRLQMLAEQEQKLDALNKAGGITADTKAAIRQALGIA